MACWLAGSLEDSVPVEISFEHDDVASSFVPAKEDQVGAISRIESALARGDAADPRRIPRGERNGFAKVKTGSAHHVRDRAIHSQRRASQARAAGETDTSIVVQLDIDFTQPIKAGSATGRHDGIGDQQRPLQTFGAQRDVQERRAADEIRPR